MKNVMTMKSQRGLTLIEALMWLALLGAIIGGALMWNAKADKGREAVTTATTVTNMVSKIRHFYRASQSYNGISPTIVNNFAVVTEPLKWSSASTAIIDPWGNTVGIVGNAAAATPSFVITLGGTTAPLDRDVCNTLVSSLINDADAVYVGASASVTTTNGVAGGGSAVKAVGGAPNITNLATGCAAASPVIAFQFH